LRSWLPKSRVSQPDRQGDEEISAQVTASRLDQDAVEAIGKIAGTVEEIKRFTAVIAATSGSRPRRPAR